MKYKHQVSGARLLAILGCLALAACGGSDGGGGGDGGNGAGTNADPTANAGDPQTVDAGVTVTLEGSGSDSDGEITAYDWKQTDGPTVTLEVGDAGAATFTAPSVEAASELAFELTVTDDGGASASDDVTVAVAPVIAMAGRIYDGPIAGANVTVTVGDRTYTAVADADGYYTVNVGSIDPDAFITITATGGEGQEHVELVSIAASFATLQAAAGDDGVLKDDESGAVDVTNLSTAKAVLMIEANDGEPITTDDAAANAEKNVNGDEMIRLATVIKLVVDGGFTLPDGVESTLDLVGDSGTTDAFVDAVNSEDPDAYQETQDQLLSDPDLLDVFDASDVPAAYNLLYVKDDEAAGSSEYLSIGRGPRFEFNADGSGYRYSSDTDTSGAFTWSVVEGLIVMNFSPALVSQGFCFMEGYPVQVACETTTTQLVLRLVLDGVNSDQLLMSGNGQTVFPDNPELEPMTSEGESSWLALSPAAEIPFTAEEIPGTWALNVAGPDLAGLSLDALSAGRLTFAADGTGTSIATENAPALALTWAVDDGGALRVDFADGSALEVRKLRVESIGFDAQTLFTTAGGDMFTDAGLIVKQQDDFVAALTAATAKGFYTLYDRHPDFAIALQAGGVATQRSYFPDAPPFDTPIAWELRDDGTVVMSYRVEITGTDPDIVTTPVRSCEGVANCHLWRQRVMTPVAYDPETGRVFAYGAQVWFDYDPAVPVDHKGAVNRVQNSLRFWGYTTESPDDDLVIGKAGASRNKMRYAPWIKLPPAGRLQEE